MILRFVSMRHAIPFSTRSIVRTEILARRASSALLNKRPSLTFRTLLGSTLPFSFSDFPFSFPGLPTVFGSSVIFQVRRRTTSSDRKYNLGILHVKKYQITYNKAYLCYIILPRSRTPSPCTEASGG